MPFCQIIWGLGIDIPQVARGIRCLPVSRASEKQRRIEHARRYGEFRAPVKGEYSEYRWLIVARSKEMSNVQNFQ